MREMCLEGLYCCRDALTKPIIMQVHGAGFQSNYLCTRSSSSSIRTHFPPLQPVVEPSAVKTISKSKLLLLRHNNPTFFSITRSCTHNPHSSNPTRYTPKNTTKFPPILVDPTTEPEEMDVGESTKTEEAAEQIAIGALARRALTAVELQKKLQSRQFPTNVIEKVLSNLQTKGYINDYLYAESFTQSRWSSSTWGPRRIKQALQRKGVSEVNAEKATRNVFEGDGNGEGDGGSVLGMSRVAMDHLYVQASKQWMRSQNVEDEKRKGRLVRWLQYRGFSWGVISYILKKLESC